MSCKPVNSSSGTVLLVVLLAMALMSAFVVEFAYGVYVSISAIHNRAESRKASLLARSSLSMGAIIARELQQRWDYRYIGTSVPIPNQFNEEVGEVTLRIEDEMGRLNINQLNQFTTDNNPAHVYTAMVKLCGRIGIPTETAAYIKDWMDPDGLPTNNLRDSEDGAKNAKLWSVNELYSIPHLKPEWIDALIPHVTVIADTTANINMNSAGKEVLASLVDDSQANDIISKRMESPFKDDAALNAFYTNILNAAKPGWAVVKSNYFRITASGRVGGINRMIDVIVNTGQTPYKIEYWREY